MKSLILRTILLLLSFAAGVVLGDTCNINGQEFERGANLGNAFETRCGSHEEYPCFCNPDVPRYQAECPYCGFSAAADQTLYCAKDDETISFSDGSIVRVCSCQIPDNFPEENPIRECTIEESAVGCEFPDENGDLVFFMDGESFGDLIPGACEPTSEYPSFCKVLPGGNNEVFDIGYPYCVFGDTQSGELVCAKNNQNVTYVNDDGDDVTCLCIYDEENAQDQPTCKTTPKPPSNPTKPPSSGVEKPTGPSSPSGPTMAPTIGTLPPTSCAFGMVSSFWSTALLGILVGWGAKAVLL